MRSTKNMRWIDLIDKRYTLTAMQLIGPPVALWAIYMYATLPWLLVSLVMFFLMKCIGTTITFHRIHSHNTHKMHPLVEFITTGLGTIGTHSSPIDFAAGHTLHHKYADTEKDPHSVKHMGWKVMFPIFWDTGGPTGGDLRTVVRLMRNKNAMFFHKHYWPIILIPYLLLFVSVPLFFFVFFVPAVMTMWSASYATLNHDDSGAKNKGWLYGILTGGEHMHKWHHDNPGDTSGEGWLNTVANMIAKKRIT